MSLRIFTSITTCLLVATAPAQSTEDSCMVVDSNLALLDNLPQFPGGDQALMTFIDTSIIYPPLALDHGIEGTVYVNFMVWCDGTIKGIKILRGIGAGCDEEVVRVIKMFPKFEPAMLDDKLVAVWYRLPVTFRLLH